MDNFDAYNHAADDTDDPTESVEQEEKRRQQDDHHPHDHSYHGLRLVSTATPLFFSSKRWIPLGANAIGTMTGLYSDVHHIQKVLQRHAEAQIALYAEETTMSVTRLVRLLSTLLQSTTRSAGGRPYAIQSMLIGSTSNNLQQNHVHSETTAASSSKAPHEQLLAIYTIDPSGGWQHYASGATAIGRCASQARTKLFHLMLTNQQREQEQQQQQAGSPQQTLQLAMQAMLETLEGDSLPRQEHPSTSDNNSMFEAVLIWKKASSRTCRVALIDPAQVDECHRKVWSDIVARSKEQTTDL
jgi:20S proteasome alpha/beta subunit